MAGWLGGAGVEAESAWFVIPRTRDDLLRSASIAVQLGFVWLLCRGFSIENSAFYNRIVPLAVVGFVASQFIAQRLRLLFFAGLSILSMPLVFGLAQGAWIIGISLALIGITYLPLAWRWRALLVVAAALLLALMRAQFVPAPWSSSIWPVLGSMFMFRMIIYLYDIKHLGRQPPALTLSYFFLMPNVVLPFFPVVDFHTFRRTYYDRNPYETYQEGIYFILRGITHLVLYRLVYQFLVISPVEILHTTDIIRFVLANFLLYLRVSGLFHMICGFLHIFGFRVPETHRFYFLPTSFTDIWRRINIYWKDFLQKTVYMPVFFRMRKRKYGETLALVVATSLVIVATWFYHSYQWFWLLGRGLWSATDVVFWVILGVALVTNVVLESRRGRRRVVGGLQVPTPAQSLRSAVRTMMIMVPLSVLWALWTSPTFAGFMSIFGRLSFRPVDIAAIVALFGGILALAYAAQRLSLGAPSVRVDRTWWKNPLLVSGVPLMIAWSAGLPSISSKLPTQTAEVLREMRVTELSRRDAQQMERGYYESLVGVSRFNAELWDVYSKQSESDWKRLDEIGVERRIDDPLHADLLPSQGAEFHGASLRTNRWGMRDRDYALEKAPGTMRIAVLGPSHVMGSGVADDETFENLVENRLNRERRGAPATKYELLNFAVEGYGLTQQRLLLERSRVWDFHPDEVLLIGHPVENFFIGRYVAQELERRAEPEDSLLRELVKRAGVTRGVSEEEAQRKMKPFAGEIIASEMRRIREILRAHGVRAVFALVPTPTWSASQAAGPTMEQEARANGFTMLDLDDVFVGRNKQELTVASWDYHPNARGHAVIADRLFTELAKRPELLTPIAGQPKP